MNKIEEKAWMMLRDHRDSMAKLASKARTSFFHKEDQESAMRMGRLLQDASDECDLSMLKLETGRDELTEADRMRFRKGQDGR